MGVGKGFTRPEYWPPVGSIVQVTERVRIGGETAAEVGDWVVIQLTNGRLIDGSDGSVHRIHLSLLFAGAALAPRFDVFRLGRNDYSNAWHQALPWMEHAR
ncbi:hypothetical protein [Microbacterium ginsengisoli]|nr:hypothetical protein [Microbacteriaceae bacterium K1510]